jgi:hypothetical protein
MLMFVLILVVMITNSTECSNDDSLYIVFVEQIRGREFPDIRNYIILENCTKIRTSLSSMKNRTLSAVE